jgi:hypothetical protein
MTNDHANLSSTPCAPRGALPPDPRSEAVSVEPGALDGGALPALLVRLTSLAHRGGSLIGEGYALAASRVLHGLERLDDLNAERRLRQRAKQGRAIPPGVSAS